MATERHTTPAVALRERLLQGRTEADLAAGFTSPLARAGGEGLPLHMWTGAEPGAASERHRMCSRGCHTLPASARFDPHSGEPLGLPDAGPPRRTKAFVLRTV
jgi:hypothetical protein